MSDPGSQSSASSVYSTLSELPSPPAQWDIDEHLPRLEKESLNVTQEHLILALDHVGGLLTDKGYPWAVMGGLALFLHGSKNRNTRDVDVAIEAKPRDVLEALRNHRWVTSGWDTCIGPGGLVLTLQNHFRIYTPPLLSMAGSGCGRFYVLTGPEYGDDVLKQVVEVDIIIAGHLGSPKTLSSAITTRTAKTAAGIRTYNVLSVEQLCRAKLHALDARDAQRDFADLEWLCMNYSREIQEVADTLDEHKRINFVKKYKKRYPAKEEAVFEALMAALKLGAGDVER